MEAKIPYHINDFSQKSIMNLFNGKEISLFGIKVPKFLESLNVELQDINIEERRADLVFLLSDDSLFHLEFQTDYKKSDLARFLKYDTLLYEQYNRRKITTVVIYSAGVKRRNFSLDFDTLSYEPHVIFLDEMDGDLILEQLEAKILNKELFNNEDLLNLLFSNFMRSGIISIKERAARQLKIANTIEDDNVRNVAIMSTIGIAGKFLTNEQMTKLSEVFTMTDPIVAMIQAEVAKEAEKIAKKLEEKDFETTKKLEEKDFETTKKLEEKDFEMAKSLLAENLDVDLIARTTKLSLDTIKDLQGL